MKFEQTKLEKELAALKNDQERAARIEDAARRLLQRPEFDIIRIILRDLEAAAIERVKQALKTNQATAALELYSAGSVLTTVDEIRERFELMSNLKGAIDWKEEVANE